MSWLDEKERAEQEKADALEEARVEREAKTWEEIHMFREPVASLARYDPSYPYLFADERSQRRAEDEARHYSKLDDYAAWQDEAVGAEQQFR